MKTQKIKPILTEKSLNDAEVGKYTFWVPVNLTKYQIKKTISEIFAVNPTKVRTINYKKRSKKNIQGKIVNIKARKKAIVTLVGKEKIELFGSTGKSK